MSWKEGVGQVVPVNYIYQYVSWADPEGGGTGDTGLDPLKNHRAT